MATIQANMIIVCADSTEYDAALAKVRERETPEALYAIEELPAQLTVKVSKDTDWTP